MDYEGTTSAENFRLPQAVEVIRGNIVKHGNPLALKGAEIARWAKGLDLPEKGELLYYTGGEYQLIPFIDSLVKAMTLVDPGGKAFSLMMGVRNLIDKTGISAEKIYASALAQDKERYHGISYQGAMILKELGVDFCYLGKNELYSGALLYELGFWDDLGVHAQKMAALLETTGAKTIVCLSPHSAEVFKLIYPKLLGEFPYEVKTFTELIWEVLKEKEPPLHFSYDGKVVIHDSCRMARELGITEEIRHILNCFQGIELVEAEQNRRWTTCCGGPSKVLFPDVSAKIGCYRRQELAETHAAKALTFCPYCLAALTKGCPDAKDALETEDFIEFLYRGVVSHVSG